MKQLVNKLELQETPQGNKMLIWEYETLNNILVQGPLAIVFLKWPRDWEGIFMLGVAKLLSSSEVYIVSLVEILS